MTNVSKARMRVDGAFVTQRTSRFDWIMSE